MTGCNLLQFPSHLGNGWEELQNRLSQEGVSHFWIAVMETFAKALRAVFNGGQIARMLFNVDKQPQQSL